ncbi:MAG: M48 family metalloprotease [Phycisphaeraceae bacterium JB051]
MKSMHKLAVMLILGAMMVLTGCSVNPATGQRQLNAISTSQEISMGAEAAPQFTQSYGGQVPSANVRNYVTEMGNKLVNVCERPDLPWEFTIVDSSVLNAFALPGGKVFLSRGLAEKLTNEAQLAGVIGHEIGHVTAQHIGQQMTRAMIIQGIGIGLAVAGEQTDNETLKVLGVGATAGGTVYMLKFGRDQESQADELGVRYMTKVGYNPMGQVQVMQVLKEASGGSSQMEILSTHPLPQTRIERLNQLISEQYPSALSSSNDMYKFNASSYQSRMLNVLRTLPAAKHNQSSANMIQPTDGENAVAALDPTDYCLFCRHQHAHHTSDN